MYRNFPLLGKIMEDYPLNANAFRLQELFQQMNYQIDNLRSTSNPKLIEEYKQNIINKRKEINDYVNKLEGK